MASPVVLYSRNAKHDNRYTELYSLIKNRQERILDKLVWHSKTCLVQPTGTVSRRELWLPDHASIYIVPCIARPCSVPEPHSKQRHVRSADKAGSVRHDRDDDARGTHSCSRAHECRHAMQSERGRDMLHATPRQERGQSPLCNVSHRWESLWHTREHAAMPPRHCRHSNDTSPLQQTALHCRD